MKNLNELAQEIHAANHKWWHDAEGNPIERNRGELLMLVITELAEAVEGIRKELMDDHLPHRKMEEVEMADAVIRLLDFAGGFKLELMDVSSRFPIDGTVVLLKSRGNKGDNIFSICRAICGMHGEEEVEYEVMVSVSLQLIEAYCICYNLDLEGAITEKLAYNRTRKDHTHEARAQAGGKKF